VFLFPVYDSIVPTRFPNSLRRRCFGFRKKKNLIALQTNKDPHVKIPCVAALTMEVAVSLETSVRMHRTTWCYVREFSNSNSFFWGFSSPSGPRPPHCWCFEITLRHTTLGRIPLDRTVAETLQHTALTSHGQTGFEPAIPAGELPQTLALDHAATEVGNINSLSWLKIKGTWNGIHRSVA